MADKIFPSWTPETPLGSDIIPFADVSAWWEFKESYISSLPISTATQTALDAKQDTLTGLTASVTELNYTDGVTSSIQAQLDGKQATITGLTASGAELNILDGATITTTELNYVDGVTSPIQTQLDAKQGDITLTTTGTSWPATLIGDTLNIPQYSAGTGNVVWPASATDWVPALFDGTTGKLIKNSTPTGTGNPVLQTSPALTTPNLWTPSAVNLTNGTGLPISTWVSGLWAGVATFLTTPSSANLASAITDETGTGSVVFNNSPSLTSPRFADWGYIADQNGNEMLAFNSNASAVNYLEIENGATGNPPHLRSRGDDANIGLHLVGKGTGEVSVCDAVDETKRLRFWLSNNGTGIITTLRSNSTGTSKTIDLPNASGELFILPSFTTGSIPFSNGTTLLQDNANLFWDDTNNRLGIGNTNPQTLLTVGSGSQWFTLPGVNVNVSGTAYVSVFDGTRQVFMGADISGYGMVGTLTNDDFVLRSNNADRIIIKSGGNVGIGTMSPTAILDVAWPNNDAIQYRTSTRSIGIWVIWWLSTLYSGSWTEIVFNIGWERARFTSGWIFGVGTTNPLGLSASFASNSATILPTTGTYQQLEVTGGFSNEALRLSLGVTTSTISWHLAGTGVIQPLHNASHFTNLLLNPSGWNVGIRMPTVAPTAFLHLGAGTATAGTAPLKFTAGTALTTPEAGTFEFTNSETGLTFTAVATRRQFVFDTATQNLTNKTLTSPIINVTSDATGDIYYRNSGGAFTRLAIGTANQVLTVISGIPSWQTPSGGGGSKQFRISIPWELVADTAGYQGLFWYNDTGASVTISNVAVVVAKAGTTCSVNVYKSSGTASDGIDTSAVNLFTSAIALGSGYTSLSNTPNTTTVESGRWVSARVTAVAGAPANLQIIVTYT